LRDSAGLTPDFPFSAWPFGPGHLYRSVFSFPGHSIPQLGYLGKKPSASISAHRCFGSRNKRKTTKSTKPFRAFRSLSCHSWSKPSTTPISSPVNPYNSYTSASICRSVASSVCQAHSRFAAVEFLISGDGAAASLRCQAGNLWAATWYITGRYLVYHWPIPGFWDWFTLSLGCLKPG